MDKSLDHDRTRKLGDDFALANDAVFTSREAGRECGVSFRTVIRWIERGELSGYRLPGRGDYRIAAADLLTFMKKHRILPQERAGIGRRVLVVDDDPGMANAIARVLRPAGCETLTVNNGFLAGVRLHSFAPSLLTLDLRMPGLDGFGVLDVLRSQAQARPPKVLVISADTPERLRAAVDRGADAALAKPFDAPELLAVVERLLPAPARA